MTSNVCKAVIDILEMTDNVYGPNDATQSLERDVKRVTKLLEKSCNSAERAQLEELILRFVNDANTGKAYMDWVRNRLSAVRTDWCHGLASDMPSRRRSPRSAVQSPRTPVRSPRTPSSKNVVKRLFNSMSPRSKRKTPEITQESPPSLIKEAGLVPRPPPREHDRRARHRRNQHIMARRKHSVNLRQALLQSASKSASSRRSTKRRTLSR